VESRETAEEKRDQRGADSGGRRGTGHDGCAASGQGME
jgi:hypothetical protein